jgi:hypothetical protein
MRSLTWQQVYARRLRASCLDRRAPQADVLRVARDVLGVHAQLMTGAELALSARVDGVTRELVAELLWGRRALVKGNTIRGTLHLHPGDDLARWKALYALHPRWREEKWLGWHELTLEQAEWLRESILALLDDGEPRTREEIGAGIGGPLGEGGELRLRGSMRRRDAKPPTIRPVFSRAVLEPVGSGGDAPVCRRPAGS